MKSRMWALRRAANQMRGNSHWIVVAGSSCAKSEIPSYESKLADWICDGGGSDASNFLPESFAHGPSFPKTSFWGRRNFSSEAGAKSGDSEDDLEDGFSELEEPSETNKLDDVAGEDNDPDLLSDGDLSEKGIAEDAEDSLGLSGTGADATSEKSTKMKSFKSPLFKIINEAPLQTVNNALDKWIAEGNALGRGEISILMVNLRKRQSYAKALQFVEWLEANKHIDFVERDYVSHLDLVAKVHGLQKAEKYIERIPKSFRGEMIYRTLMANCVSVGNIKKAEEVFNKIRDLGLPISIFSCNQLLLLYKRVDRKKIADVLLMMEKENIKPTLFTYRLLIDTKGRSNDISGMEQIVETMKVEGGIELDWRTQSMVAKHYIFGGIDEKAESMLKEIEGDDIKENRNACKVLLPLYATLGKAEDVGRIWEVCESNPRLDECLAAIEAWGKLGNVEKAEKVFEDMLEAWKPSSRYFNALLKVYANHKLLSKGKELTKRMSDSGCMIGPLTWDALVKLYVAAGEVEKADSILQKASQQIKPLYSSYITLLDQYAKRGDIHNAEKIFHGLRQVGYAGRMRQYSALLQAYVNAKTPAYGFRERMKADNMFPNKAVAAQLAVVDLSFRKSPI